jgi:hypothetical protein
MRQANNLPEEKSAVSGTALEQVQGKSDAGKAPTAAARRPIAGAKRTLTPPRAFYVRADTRRNPWCPGN